MSSFLSLSSVCFWRVFFFFFFNNNFQNLINGEKEIREMKGCEARWSEYGMGNASGRSSECKVVQTELEI